MNFILYNNFFENFITILMSINIFGIIYLEFMTKGKLIDGVKKLNANQKFKFFSVSGVAFIILITLYVLYKNLFLSWLFILIIINSSTTLFKKFKNNNLTLSIDDKHNYIYASLLFVLFFSSFSAPIYIDSLIEIDHIIKEILLTFYIPLKLIFFVFFSLINILVLISNFLNNETISQKKYEKLLNKVVHEYTPIFYNFDISSEKDSAVVKIFGGSIFVLSLPYFLLKNILNIIVIKIKNFLLKTTMLIIQIGIEFYKNKNIIIMKIVKIGTIIALIITNIIIMFNTTNDKVGKIFSNEINVSISFISSVILIPLIYDSIKPKNIDS